MSENNLVEIVDAETKVSEIAVPTKVTGYLAFHKNNTGKWDMVSSFRPDAGYHPVLPYWCFETKQDAVTAAMSHRASGFIKIVAVEFEV